MFLYLLFLRRRRILRTLRKRTTSTVRQSQSWRGRGVDRWALNIHLDCTTLLHDTTLQ